MFDDWRVQAATTLAADLPAAYPGGPSHKAGSHVVLSSQVTPAEGIPIGFPTPSAVALALSIAAQAARTARGLRVDLKFGDAISPSGTVRSLDRQSTTGLFNYFESCLVAVVFSIQALEAYSNYKIAYLLKDNIEVQRRDGPVTLTPAEAERQLSLDEKLGDLLPKLIGVPSPKGRAEWEAYVHLRRLRDATVHLKSHHQWTTGDGEDFEDSPYAWFVQKTADSIPSAAMRMLRYFARDHEVGWIEGADKVLAP